MSDRGVTMSAHSRARRSPLPHILAGGLALLYAWLISRTPYVTTGVQFVSPLAVIVLAHMTWMGAFDGLRPGYARTILGRALTTATGIAAATLLAALHTPEAAEAQTGLAGSFSGLLVVFGCLASRLQNPADRVIFFADS